MGDKNPKSREREKKQETAQKARDRAAHDQKQAPATPATPKGKGR